MQMLLLMIIAIVVSVAWVGTWVLTYLPGTILPIPIIDPEILGSIFTLLTPLLFVWTIVLIVSFKSRFDNDIRTLNNQGQNLRSLLTSYNKQLGQLISTNNNGSQVDDNKSPEMQENEAAPIERSEGDPESDDGEISLEPQLSLPVAKEILIKALNLADHENDTEAFEALDIAGKEPEIEQILNLTMQLLKELVEFRIAVDRLEAEFAHPDEWRQIFTDKSENELAFLGLVGNHNQHHEVREMFARNPALVSVSDDLNMKVLNLTRIFVLEAEDDEVLAFANTRTLRTCMLIQCSVA